MTKLSNDWRQWQHLGASVMPEDIARVILFLVSDESAWITAQNIGVNGGFA